MASAHSEANLKKKGMLSYENDHYVRRVFQDLVPFIPQELLFCYRYVG